MPALAIKPEFTPGPRSSFEADRITDVAQVVTDLYRGRVAANEEFLSESDTRFVLTQPGQPNKVFERLSEQTWRLTQWRHKAYVPAQRSARA